MNLAGSVKKYSYRGRLRSCEFVYGIQGSQKFFIILLHAKIMTVASVNSGF